MAQVPRREATAFPLGVPTIPAGKSPLLGIAGALDIAGAFVQKKNEEIIRTKEVDFQTTSLSTFRTFADKLQGELKPNFGEDLNGYGAAYQEQLNTEIQRITDSAPTPQSRNVALSQLSQVMDSMSGRARRDEENAVVETAKAHLDQNINAYISEVFRDPDKISENLALMADAVDSAPWIKDKSKGNLFKIAKREEMWLSYARHFRENDPVELLADLKEGFYDKKLTPVQIAALKDQADAEIFRNEQRGRAESNRALRQLAKNVNEHAFVTERGEDWDGDIMTTRQALIDIGGDKADELLEIVDESIELGADLKKFSSLTIPNMTQDLITSREGPQTKRSLRLLERKLRSFKQTQNAINTGLGFDLAIKRGIIKAPEPINTTDPQIREAQLDERVDMANTARAWLGVEVSPFTATEKAGFIRTIRGTDVDAQEGLLNFLSDLPPGMRRMTANTLSKDAPEFAIGMDIVRANGSAARGIMDGLQITRNEQQGKQVPPDKLFNDIFRQEIGSAFARSAEHQNAVFQASKALYVARVGPAGLRRDEVDTDVYKEAVKDITGGMITRDSGFFDPGHKIVPPIYGMIDDEFDALLQQEDKWADMQVNVTPDNARSNGTFVHAGAGQYNIIMPNGQPLMNRDGTQRFVLDLSDAELIEPEELNALEMKRAVEQIKRLELRGL